MSRQHVTTCEVCERTAPTGNHPCMFGAASGPCACWRGVPCKPSPKSPKESPR